VAGNQKREPLSMKPLEKILNLAVVFKAESRAMSNKKPDPRKQTGFR
jgi:hypothetical protein